MGIYKTQSDPSKIGNYMVHVGKPGVLGLGEESIVVGYAQKQIGLTEPAEGEEPQPIWADDESQPIRELTGYWLYEVDGAAPSEQEVEIDYEEPAPEPPPAVTVIEILQQSIQARLDGDEEKRTGVRPNPTGSVPLSRSWAAAAMIYGGWHYPSEADLAAGANPAILAAIYADPSTNTTAESPTEQKQKVLHFTLVMLEGQTFGLEYQSQLGAYERTASGAIREAIAADPRDWLDLPCHTWESVRAMFLDVLK